MTSSELKDRLIEANKSRREPRTDVEINDIVAKYEKGLSNRNAMNVATKSTKAKLSDIIKEFNGGDIRMFACGGIGAFVKKNNDGTADVAFSFLNIADAKEDGFKLSIRNTKYHAALNYKLGKYTYKVAWRGRSEFAVYDAFVANKNEFPSHYKYLSMGISVSTPVYEDENGDLCFDTYPFEF